MFDLSFQTERERLASTILTEVDAESVEAFREPEPRYHLGASQIGDECERKAWYAFRWIKEEDKNGRQYRLLNRGHLEEQRFVDRLNGIGWKIYEVDETTGKQFKISGCKGHYGGSLDGIGIPPPRYNLNEPLLVEFKTHKEKSFTKLAGKQLGSHPTLRRDTKTAEGVRKSKPTHYGQMSAYGQAYGFRFGLYCAVNKDTDELYFEIVALDWNLGVALYQKAERVIFSQSPPAKLSQSPAFFTCKYLCPFPGVCHGGEAPDRNCRSCEHAFAVDDGQWHCRVHEANIPREFIPVGCPQYKRIV
jgi:hypothetical protein